MNPIELMGVPIPVQVRQSAVKCAYSCKRKWWYKYRMGIVLRGEKIKVGATLGTIYHKFKELGPGKSEEVRAWLRGKQAVLMARVDKGEDLDGSIVRQANLLTELCQKAEVMAKLFWDRYPPSQKLKTIKRELHFEFEYAGLVIAGFIDLIQQNTEDKLFWVRDDKTTGKTLSTLFGGLAWSIQARLYRLGAIDYLEKEGLIKSPNEVRGFIMDGILSPGIKLCGKDEKNATKWGIPAEEAYLRRVGDWYSTYEEEKGKPTILSKGMFYQEHMYPAELLEAIMVMTTLRDSPADDLNGFPRDITRDACFKYETQCEYHDLCTTPPEQWGQLFDVKYKVAKPKPEKKDEDHSTKS